MAYGKPNDKQSSTSPQMGKPSPDGLGYEEFQTFQQAP
jgi:hypothetical protein